MNTVTIEGVQCNLDQLALENENADQLKSRDIFPEGAKQASSYDALWKEVKAVKSVKPDTTVEVVKLEVPKEEVPA